MMLLSFAYLSSAFIEAIFFYYYLLLLLDYKLCEIRSYNLAT